MKSRITLGLIVLTTCFASASMAQSETWMANIGVQLATQLDSESRAVKSQAIQKIHYFALYQTAIDLSTTVPALVGVYKNDPDRKLRLAAVAALHAIGDDAGMQAVRKQVIHETDQQVQMVSIAALRDHFGLGTFANSKEIGQMARAILDNIKARDQALARK